MWKQDEGRRTRKPANHKWCAYMSQTTEMALQNGPVLLCGPFFAALPAMYPRFSRLTCLKTRSSGLTPRCSSGKRWAVNNRIVASSALGHPQNPVNETRVRYFKVFLSHAMLCNSNSSNSNSALALLLKASCPLPSGGRHSSISVWGLKPYAASGP